MRILSMFSVLFIALHLALFMLFRRWMDRDLLRSFAGDDLTKCDDIRAPGEICGQT